MNETAFVEKREPDWQKLMKLCDRADVSPATLKAEDLKEFVRLYRQTSADLAEVRTRSANVELAEFLNDLTARAYGLLYRRPGKALGRALGEAVATAAQTFRRNFVFIALAFFVFVFGGVASYVLIETVPATRSVLVPAEAEELFDSWAEGRHELRSGGQSAQMTGFYMSNNPRVAVTAGSLAAATFGVGTAYILWANGQLIGSLTHHVHQAGQSWFLYSSILPHGVPELTGIFVSGGAGFRIGWALISPGRRRRGEALKDAGRDAIILLLTAYVLMFLAAPIEGFFSFNPVVPQGVKFVFAVVTAVLWALFWIGYGRSDEEKAQRADAAS